MSFYACSQGVFTTGVCGVPSKTALTVLSGGEDGAIHTGQKIITQDLARLWESTPVLFRDISSHCKNEDILVINILPTIVFPSQDSSGRGISTHT